MTSTTAPATCSACAVPVRVTKAGRAYKHGTYTTCVGSGRYAIRAAAPDLKGANAATAALAVTVMDLAIDIS